MRILVYGAGVQGCELAHRLLQNKKNVVTMLARGEWKERLDQRGLVIRHWAQCRTTVDRVATIDTLAPDDCYDLVFVTMQAGQLPDVLPILKQNRSEYFVFVGNDPHAVEVMQAMQRPADKIAFPVTGLTAIRPSISTPVLSFASSERSKSDFFAASSRYAAMASQFFNSSLYLSIIGCSGETTI